MSMIGRVRRVYNHRDRHSSSNSWSHRNARVARLWRLAVIEVSSTNEPDKSIQGMVKINQVLASTGGGFDQSATI